MYKKYKKTIPGLYYINNSFDSIKKLILMNVVLIKLKLIIQMNMNV